jgi:uncharacterized LabA/DUF88 family protein
MPHEPAIKKTVAYIDGQNLFHAATQACCHTYPNYDVLELAKTICQRQRWNLVETRFYTGVPDEAIDWQWSRFWRNKLGEMGRQGIIVYSRPLAYSAETISVPGGGQKSILVPREKGVDIRLALDVIQRALNQMLDVALIFSQDQDLTEVADEVKAISVRQNRWIQTASAFPISPASKNRRGIDHTYWIPIEKPTYDACLDPKNYFPKKKSP